MPSAPGVHQSVIATTLIVPLSVMVVMTGIESLVENLGWRLRLVKAGWDLCAMALGTISVIFGLPEMQERLGSDAIVIALGLAMLCIGAALAIMHIRKRRPEDIGGIDGILAAVCGIVAIGLPWYFALHF